MASVKKCTCKNFDLITMMYDKQFLQSVLKKGIFGARNAIFGPKTKSHKNDKLLNNQESLTSASHIFVYSSEPSPW